VFIAIVFFFSFRVDARKVGQVTNLTIVGGIAKHCVDQRSVHGFVSILFVRGRHCYAWLATC